ncbi:helix-turn-helix domain-containing protein (plasmid) [Rhodococcus opacus]|uniref:helix-turn-helix domain-containing protein n=1 Tax=Rhodococcus opacus TaxID=37919 RepID=UPI0034D1D445
MTHVLLPVTLLLRRAYLAELIFSALEGRACGDGHRRIAARSGVPASTVRGWIRAMTGRVEAVRSWFLGIAVTAGVDVRIPKATGTGCGDVVAAIAVAAAAVVDRFGGGGFVGGVTVSAVAVVGSGGRLLAPGWPSSVGFDSPTPVGSDAGGGGARSSDSTV